jgi:hypothetical protein
MDMIDQTSFLIQKQRKHAKEKSYRSMIKRKLRQFGRSHLANELEYLKSSQEGITSKIYGLASINMTYIMETEIRSYDKKAIVMV